MAIWGPGMVRWSLGVGGGVRFVEGAYLLIGEGAKGERGLRW